MSKRMTAAKWLELAEVFAVSGDAAAYNGICDAIATITEQGLGDGPSHNFYNWGKTANHSIFWWPLTDTGDRQRSDFCLLMWAMGTKAYRELVGEV